ncbi:hypothetical protein A3F66_03160 [candidate division TM6 bacterium RIFCSPHIGHO2_12_FULL_32_22]|nr:MAG: hypothetical protein A3F66_03160 [candidate division TM6 bacterium RIFCSPHIGHO2_12_FULL_32_22]
MKKMLVALFALVTVAVNLQGYCGSCNRNQNCETQPEYRMCEEFVRREVPAIPHKHVSWTYTCPEGCTPCGEIVAARLE